MQIVGVIQCRMSSSRLPGKALVNLGTRPVLEWVILRSLRARHLAGVVLATTSLPEDDPVAELGERFSLPVIRGNKENVLSRYLQVIEQFRTDGVVRITADNPLTAPEIIDQVCVSSALDSLDYGYGAGIPYGAGVDFFKSSVLVAVHKNSKKAAHLEHINLYFLENHLTFRIGSIPPPNGCNRPDVRITLDDEADLDRLKALFSQLPSPEKSTLAEIIAAYDQLPQKLYC